MSAESAGRRTTQSVRGRVNRLASLFTTVLRIAMAISTLAIGIVMIMTVGDIVGRAALNKGVPGAYEITEATMVFIVFLAFGYTEATGQNIRVGIVATRLPSHLRKAVDVFGCLVGIVFFGLILWNSWPRAVESWQVREFMTGTLPLPLYPAKFMVPIGSALVLIQFLIDLVRNATGVVGRSEHA